MRMGKAFEQAPEQARNSCMVGNIGDWPLSDLLLWLHHTQRTAMIRIGFGLDAGVIFFREGKLFRCEWGALMGEQAVAALMQLTEGSFTLIQRDIPEARTNVVMPTAELLMECAVAIDEARRS